MPAALAISAFAPWAVTPLLMIGGAYLCYEGFEKLAHKFLHSQAEDEAHHAELVQALADPAVDLVALEQDKIKGAVRTDFILSAEIIVITLGTVADAPFATQVAVLVGIALLMTVGVYGLVAGIVKLDDAGLSSAGATATRCSPGSAPPRGGILRAAPWLMKGLSVAGTAAMFLVGGGILVHGIPALHHWIEDLAEGVAGAPRHRRHASLATSLLSMPLMGVVAGGLVLAVVSGVQRVLRPRAAEP